MSYFTTFSPSAFLYFTQMNTFQYKREKMELETTHFSLPVSPLLLIRVPFPQSGDDDTCVNGHFQE